MSRTKKLISAFACFSMVAQPMLAQAITYSYHTPIREVKKGAEGGGKLSFSRIEVDFGEVAAPDKAIQTIEVTNSGKSSISFSKIELQGTGFSHTTTCGSYVAPNASCQIAVQFAPTASGRASGAIQVSSDDKPATRTILLAGRGTGGSLLASTYLFPEPRQIDAELMYHDTQVRNVGKLPVAISGVSLIDENEKSFSQSNDCLRTLAVSESCTVRVGFSPKSAGTLTNKVAVLSDADNSPLLFEITGVGRSPDAGVIAPTFDKTQVGESVVSAATITNKGVGMLSIESIAVSGAGFVKADADNTCGKTLAAGSSCSFKVQFTPTKPGTHTGEIVTLTSAGETRMELAGTGQAPEGTLSDVDFGDVDAGSSTLKAAVLKNTGIGPLTVVAPTSQTVTGDRFTFAGTTCAEAVPVNGACSVSVRYSPLASSAGAGQLALNTGAGKLTSNLTGRGQQATLTLSPASLPDFGNVQVGQSTTSSAITLKNVGNAPASNLVLKVSDGFSVSDSTCGTSLGAGASCTFKVTFAPSGAQSYKGVLNVQADAPAIVTEAALAGSGVAQAATLGGISFGSRTAGAAVEMNATLANTGSGPLSLTVPTASSVTGTGFSFVSTNCASALPANGTCTIRVRFAATNADVYGGQLTLATGAGIKQAILSGQGLQGEATVSTGLVAFPDVQVGSVSSVIPVTLTNSGNSALNITGISIADGVNDFKQTNGCEVIPAGGVCTINVRFEPSQANARTGVLAISHDGSGVSLVNLTGTGRSQAATLSTPSFAETAKGATSLATATLSNTGIGPVSVAPLTGAAVTGTDFSYSTSTCGTSLAVGASCQVTVAFSPTAATTRTGTLSVNTGAGTKTASLTATSVQGVATITPASWTFGTQQQGSASTKVFSLKNTGTAVLRVTGVQAQGVAAVDYVADTACSNVAPEATCSISVNFTPSAGGVRDATINVNHDGGGASTIIVTGSGQAPSATLSAPAFAGTPTGTSSTALATLTNTGIGTLTLTVPSASNVTGTDFAFVSTTCAGTLASGNSCSVTVRYSATSTAVANGNLSITTSAGIKSAGLSAQGIQGTAGYTPGSLAFASQQTGTTSTAQTIQLKNTGSHTLVVSNVVVANNNVQFSRTHNCATLAVGATCSISVTFSPSATGEITGAITVSHNGNGSSSIPLTGQGQAPAASLSTPAFAATPVGSTSTATAVLTNTGIAPITVTAPTSASVSGEGFTFVNTTCGGPLAASTTCQVVVQFSPNSTTARTGTLAVSTGAGVKTVSLGSTAIQGYAAISPGSLSFDKTQVNKSAPTRRITVTNTGTHTLAFVGVGMSSGESDFQQDNTCKSVPVGGTCAIDVQFTPSQAGLRYGTVSLVHDGGGIAHVSLTGEGQAASATLSTPSFTTPEVGSSGQATATLTNTGLDSISITPVTSSVVTGSSFSFVSTTCATTLAASSSCQVTVRFTPASTATQSGTLTLNTGAGVKSVPLTASGRQGRLSLNNSNLNFGSQSVGVSSPSQTITVTNTGTAPLTISGVSVVEGVNDYGRSNTCASALAVGGSCSITVMFTPYSTGSRSGYLAISHNGDNGDNGTATVVLSGTGVAPASITKANFTNTTATVGNTIGFVWTTANVHTVATSCSGSFPYTTSSSTGTTLWLTPTAPGKGTCTVVATNSVGTQVSQTVEVTVVEAPAITAQFSASEVVAGREVVFSWTAVNATSADVNCSGSLSGTSATAPSGTLTMQAAAGSQGLCVVNAVNAYGGSSRVERLITVRPGASFGGHFNTQEVIDSDYVTISRNTTFYWSANNATNVAVTCYNPSGSVQSTNSVTSNSASMNFSTLGAAKCTVSGQDLSGAAVSADFPIQVVAAPTVGTASFLPSSIPANSTSSFRWTTSNATSATVVCSAALGGVSTQGLSGTNFPVRHQSGQGTPTCTVTPKNIAGYTGSVRTATLTITPAPIITSFTAAKAQVSQGQTNTLSWAVSNSVNTYSLSCSGGSTHTVPSSPYASNATATASAGGTATCTLTVAGPGGSTSATLTFDVVPLATISGGFSPSVIEAGQAATFNWNTTNATEVYLSSCGDFGQAYGARATSGSFTASTTTSMSGTYSCQVQAKNSLGVYSYQTYNLEVNGPPIVDSFGRTTPSPQWGQTVTVAWSVRKANSVTVACSGGATASGSGLTGSLQVVAKNSVKCTLTATGTKGQVVSYDENISPMSPVLQTSFSGFPSTPVNTTSTGTITLTSQHGYPIPMTAPSSSSLATYTGTPGTITFVSTTCGTTLAANSSCTVTLRFAPKSSYGYYGVDVTFITEAGSRMQSASGMTAN